MKEHGGTGDAPTGVQGRLELQIGAFQNDSVFGAANIRHAIENNRTCVCNGNINRVKWSDTIPNVLVKLYEASEALVSPQTHVNEALPPLNLWSSILSH